MRLIWSWMDANPGVFLFALWFAWVVGLGWFLFIKQFPNRKDVK